MRKLALIAALLGVCLGSAVDYGTALSAAIRSLPPKTEGEPVSPPSGGTPPIRIERAGSLERSGKVIRLTNGAAVKIGERNITGETAVIDEANDRVEVSGGASVVGAGDDIQAERISADLRFQRTSLTDARFRLGPRWFDGRVTDNLYVRAGEADGNERGYFIVSGRCTTCGESHPHYHLGADRIEIFPSDRIILRGARINILGSTILKLPALTIPLLENSNPRYLPLIGQSRDEGYFIKSRFATPVGSREVVDILADAMSKLGFGVGAEYTNNSGTSRIYSLFGNSPSLTVSQNYNGKLGGGNLSFDGLFLRNNYAFAPETTTTSLRANYAEGGFNLSGYRTSTSTSGFSSVAESVSLRDRRTWGVGNSRRDQRTRGGRGLITDINLTWNRSQSRGVSSAVESERMDLRFLAQQNLGAVDAELLYERSIPIGESRNFNNNRDRTPLLSFKSDGTRLGWFPASTGLRFDIQGSLGEWRDPVRQRPISRFFLDSGISGSRRVGALSTSYQARLQQGIYSDDTAQYVLRSDIRSSYQFGPQSSLNLTYRYLKPVGFTPIQADRTGRADSLSLDASYQIDPRTSLGVQTGYDFYSGFRGVTPWQQVGIRAEYLAPPGLTARLFIDYDTFSSVWNQGRLDAIIQQGDLRLTLGTRYDARRSVWGGVNAIIEGFRAGQVTAAALFDYNGYTKQLDSQQWQLIYDLHCAEMVFEFSDSRVGFRSGRQIGLFLRIKALPGGSPFGQGTRGQSLIGLGG